VTNTPLFLTLDQVLLLHAYQTEHHGGSKAVLNIGGLESALAQPPASFGGNFLHEDLPTMAAAYLFHIVQNHPFEDGNKRAGTHAAIAFLAMNGYQLNLPLDESEQLILRVAQGQAQKPEIADFFRRLINDQYPPP
jgi:death-on-curing protein